MELSERKRWHRTAIERATILRRLLSELIVMPAAMFENWARVGRLRPHALDGRELLRDSKGRPAPRGAWELLQWVAGACMRSAVGPDGKRRNFNAVQIPWRLLAAACGCAPSQLRGVAVDWLLDLELLQREHDYRRATAKRRGFRRDGSAGTRNQVACVLMLGTAGAALMRGKAKAAAAHALRVAERVGLDAKNQHPNDCFSSDEEKHPPAIREAVQPARARVEDETPATPAPRSIVHVERLRRAVPPELRHRRVRPLTRRQGGAGISTPAAASETYASATRSPVEPRSAAPAIADAPPPAKRPRSGGGGDDGGIDPRELLRLTLAAMRGDAAAREKLAEFSAETIAPAVGRLAAVAQTAILEAVESPNGGGIPGARELAPASSSWAGLFPPDRYAGCASDADEEARDAAIRARNAARFDGDDAPPLPIGALLPTLGARR